MNIEEQVALLMQGTEYGDEDLKTAMTNELRERLIEVQKEDRSLKVYCGYDPTKPDLHLGHTITMRKLRQFQDLGHEVFFVIGTGTSLVGDPSDRDKLRPQMTPEQIKENARTYAEQVFQINILDRQKTKVVYNGDWLTKLTLTDLIKLGSNFTIQQFLTRENFKKRWDNGDAVYLHETFYSLMQGYDAYELRADVQVGGTDQLFNIATAARKIMAYYGEKPNIAILMGILPGTDGVVRMSKSTGNYIPINTNAEDMYGKVMSIPDSAMPIYFRLVTNWMPKEIEMLEADIKSGKVHPRDAKMRLAKNVSASFYGEAAAQKAEEEFVRMFQKHSAPQGMDQFKLEAGMTLLDVMLVTKLAGSKSEARRLADQNGIRLDGEPIKDVSEVFPHPGVLQVGKRKFIKVI